MFHELHRELPENVLAAAEAVAVDAGYKTPEIMRKIIRSEKVPVVPYKRPMTKKGFFASTNMYMMNITIAIYARTTRF